MFWVLGFLHIPLMMYEPIETLRNITFFGQELIYEAPVGEEYIQTLRNVCMAGFVTVQIATYFLENVIPLITVRLQRRSREAQRRALGAAQRRILEICDEGQRSSYTTFDDWYDVTLFLGYGTVYSLLYPLGTFINWINNMVELRTDPAKIMRCFRRPSPRKMSDIGMWGKCMWAQVYMSAVQIALCMSFSTNMFERYTVDLGSTVAGTRTLGFVAVR